MEISQNIIHTSLDGKTIVPVRVFSPEVQHVKEQQADPKKPLVIIWPGWGMGARYYDPTAQELARRGYSVATGELRGQGDHPTRPTRKNQYGYHDNAALDYPGVIRAAKEDFNLPVDYPTVLLCHSMGGQIAVQFLARPEAQELNIQGVFGVGAGSPYIPGFQLKNKLKLLVGQNIMLLGAWIRGYWSDTIIKTGYGRQSRDHIQEWRKFARTNSPGKLHRADIDYQEQRSQVRTPVEIVRFANDDDCPLESAKNILPLLPNADTRARGFPEKLGHNSWAREAVTVSNYFEDFLSKINK